MYYNTNKLNVLDDNKATNKTKVQQEVVKHIFLKHKKMTASECHSIFNKNVPITSIRRAMSDLKKEGILVKTDILKDGIYGSPEHIYSLNSGQLSMF
jgi:predicted HTH transcriptional regulator